MVVCAMGRQRSNPFFFGVGGVDAARPAGPPRLGKCVGGSDPLQSRDGFGKFIDDARHTTGGFVSPGSPYTFKEQTGDDTERNCPVSEVDCVDLLRSEAARQGVDDWRKNKPLSPRPLSPLRKAGGSGEGWHGRYPDNYTYPSDGYSSHSTTPLTSPKDKPPLMVLSEDSGPISDVYVTKQKIGEGHSGVVNVVESRLSGELFACKSMKKKRMKGSKVLAELRSEIKAMLDMAPNPNAVELRDVFEDEKEVHLVMDYYPKGDLFDHLAKRGRVAETEAAFIIRQVASVLQHAHNKDYAHRDIKPENVFISAMRTMQSDKGFVQVPEVKLGDWGLAQHLPRGKRGENVVGSCIYMAPEVLDGNYGCEVDIWSLGVTLYVALSGYLPFWAKTNDGIFEAIRTAKPDYTRHPWPLVSPQAKSLVRWMLHPDPTIRITAGGVLAHPWILTHCKATPLRCILTTPKLPMAHATQEPSKVLPRRSSLEHTKSDAESSHAPLPLRLPLPLPLPLPPPHHHPKQSDASLASEGFDLGILSRQPDLFLAKDLKDHPSLNSPRSKLTRPQYRSCEPSTLHSLERKSSEDLSPHSRPGPLSPSKPPSPGVHRATKQRSPAAAAPPLAHLPLPSGSISPIPPLSPVSPVSPHSPLPPLTDVSEENGFASVHRFASVQKEVSVESSCKTEVASARHALRNLQQQVRDSAPEVPISPKYLPLVPGEGKRATMQEIFSSLMKLPDILPSLHRAGSGLVGSGDSSTSTNSSNISRQSSSLLPLDSPVTPLDLKYFFGMEGVKVTSPSGRGNTNWKVAAK